ncbi:MAG: FkbM family methyltransferase [Kiloniellaceae bacterium]
MSKTVASTLTALVTGASAWMKPYRRAITRALVAEGLVQEVAVKTAAGPLRFQAPTARALHDPWRLYENEPETIRWLDGLPADEVLWDIGANIGVYALYAAKARGMRVLAFEPSAATYAVLVRNVELNGLDERVDAYCLAFDETNRLDHLYMANTEAGHSMHAFGQTRTVQGEMKAVFRQAVPGFSVDAFRRTFGPPPPDHVKLDVDSIELRILKGARQTLRAHVKTVLVEIDGSTRESGGGGIRELLDGLGFVEDTAFAAGDATRNVLFRKAAAGSTLGGR